MSSSTTATTTPTIPSTNNSTNNRTNKLPTTTTTTTSPNTNTAVSAVNKPSMISSINSLGSINNNNSINSSDTSHVSDDIKEETSSSVANSSSENNHNNNCCHKELEMMKKDSNKENDTNNNIDNGSNDYDENCEEDEDDDYYDNDNDDDYDDCNYDNNNNNYICGEDDDLLDDDLDPHSSTDIYLNDPEHFDYQSFPISKLDWIVKKKCAAVCAHLGPICEPRDALRLLKQFTWSVHDLIVECDQRHDGDKKLFLLKFLPSPSSSKPKSSSTDKTDEEFVNIFSSENSDYFSSKKQHEDEEKAEVSAPGAGVSNSISIVNKSKKQVPDSCEICCFENEQNDDGFLLTLDSCGSHYFCVDCWYRHFENLIVSTGASSAAHFECMQTKCKAQATKEFVVHCLTESSAAKEKKVETSMMSVSISGGCTPTHHQGTPLSSFASSFIEQAAGESVGPSGRVKRSILGRYREMVAKDLIKASDDLRMCPGEIFCNVQEDPSHKQYVRRPSMSSSALSLRMATHGGINGFNVNQTPSLNSAMTAIAANFVPQSAPASFRQKQPRFAQPSTTGTTSNSTPTTSYHQSTFINQNLIHNQSTASTNNQTLEAHSVRESPSVPRLSKKCDHVVWIKSRPASRRVQCSACNTQYCFLCSQPYHAPNSCARIRKWVAKCQDDSETRNYLLVHTQDCPKCKVCIEKNGGCSHMTCNRCKHEFCWVCLNDWKSHGSTYDCNRYKGNPAQDDAREALNRYTHYYHRWINHTNSLKLEKEFKERSLLRISEKIMNKGGGTMVDWEFFMEAVDTLTRARYTLQYTYPYAYYLDHNESKFLFENIQAELEREVENLSHSLEKVNLNDKFSIKTQMNIVEKRRKTLLKDFIE